MMIKCIPIVIAFDTRKMAFHVVIVDTNLSIDTSYTTYGDGHLDIGKKIGEASLILHNYRGIWEHIDTDVLYLDGYRYDGKDFTAEIEASIEEVCNKAAKAIWFEG